VPRSRGCVPQVHITDARRCPHSAPSQSPHQAPLSVAGFHMSTSNQITDASTNFIAIFEAASDKYKSLTGQDLRTHPLAAELGSNNNSPDSVLGVFRKQAQALDKFHNGDDKLMKYLSPIVNILFTFSTTAGADIGLVSLCCFSVPILQYLFLSHSRLQRYYLRGLAFFLG
jgi:hypothetical protein